MALSTISGTTGITDATITSAKLADFAAAVDLNGVELILDADQDTSITADTDDRIDFKIANVEHFSFSNSSGDTIVKPMVDAKDIKFQQYDGRTLLDINDGGFVGIANGATGAGAIRIFEDTDNGSNYVGLSVGNVSTSYTLVFPNADGSSGQVMTTNGSGVLSFADASANTPSSADGQALGSASLEWSDLFLADASTIQFGNDQDVILTHVADTGLLLSGTNVIQFNDASQNIGAPSATVLDINATDEIELNATLVDVNANLDVSGTIVGASTLSATTGTFSGILKTDDATDATSTTDGSLQTDGGLSVAKDTIIGNDLKLLSDSAVLVFGAGSDATLTHTNDTGLTLNSTNKLMFNDASQFIQGASATVLDIAATDEIELTATLIDVVGNLAGSGTGTFAGILKTDDATEATSTTDGSLQTDGGLSVVKDIVAGDDIKLLSDASVIHFGANSEVTLTHTHDSGLALKHTATADDKPINLVLQTGETDMAADDVIGKISFQAPDESTGTDAILVSAAVQAVAEGDHSSSSNATRLEFHTGASELATSQMTISSGGIVGIGAVPTGDLGVGLHIKTADSGASVSSEADELVIEHGNAIGGMTFLAATDGLTKIAFGDSGNNDAGIIHYSHDGTHMAFTVEGSERLRIDSAGRILANTTSAIDTNAAFSIKELTNYPLATKVDATGNTTQIAFNNGNGNIGSITTNGTATAFNTSSDYRLKENVDYDFDATTRLKQLKPSRFNFKTDASKTVDGFLAHEVSNIIPEAITGTKDATETKQNVVLNANGTMIYNGVLEQDYIDGKADGNYPSDSTWIAEKEVPVYQSIDQAKLVPLLVKTVQELEARIKTLEDA